MPSVNVNHDEVVVVMMDYLKHRGFISTLNALEKESKLSLDSYGQEITFLRRLMLDAQWEDFENMVRPLSGERGFDLDRILFLIRRQKFLELLYQQSLGNAVVELVDRLKELEGKCSKAEFQQLCYCLTLKKLTDHPDFRLWTPHAGRLNCFEAIRPYLENVYGRGGGGGVGGGIGATSSGVPTVDDMEPMRLVTLLKQALLYQLSQAYRAHGGKLPSKVVMSIFRDYAGDADGARDPVSGGMGRPQQGRFAFPASPAVGPMGTRGADAKQAGAVMALQRYSTPRGPSDRQRESKGKHGGRSRSRRSPRDSGGESWKPDIDRLVPDGEDAAPTKRRGGNASSRQPRRRGGRRRRGPKGGGKLTCTHELDGGAASKDPSSMEPPLRCLSFSPRGDRLALGTASGDLTIVSIPPPGSTATAARGRGDDALRATPLRVACRLPSVHLDAVMCVDWCSSNSALVATGSRDNNVRLSVVPRGGAGGSRARSVIIGTHGSAVRGVRFRPKYPHVLAGTRAGGVCGWECTRAVATIMGSDSAFARTTGRIQLGDRPLFTLKNHTATVTALSVCERDPALLVSASRDGRVVLWDLRSGSFATEIKASAPVEAVEIASNGRQILYGYGTAKRGGAACVWDIVKGRARWKRRREAGCRAVAWTPGSGSYVAAGFLDRTVELLSADSGAVVDTGEHQDYIAALAWSPQMGGAGDDSDGPGDDVDVGALAALSADATVKLWSCAVPSR